MNKILMLGNEAIARGLYEAGVKVVSSYPGTPSTEITEFASKYDEIYCEWATNEKVSVEVSHGACVGGARAFSGMKHVGLNVAADPLFTASYTGVNGGLVIAVADDPGMHSSQNEQDSRHYAIAAKIPMLEPSDSQECIDYVKLAYKLSEEYDTPVLIRLSTRVSHSQSPVILSEREEVGVKDYNKDPSKFVMMPAYARGRHVFVEERMSKLTKYASESDINKIEYNDKKIGIITGGISYQYAKEVMPNASYLKLGMINPLPIDIIKEFAKNVETLYVIEELDPIIENHVKALGIKVIGKEIFSIIGEFSQKTIAKAMGFEENEVNTFDSAVPNRPPVMCPGCPHRGIFYLFKKLKLYVSGDIGCYTLGAAPPLGAMDTTVCMGASISGLHGYNKARGIESAKKSVAVIGDSTFMHSGITGLIDIVYNKGFSNVVIVDNSITGMTGHQQNPTTGNTIKNEPTNAVSIEKVVEACGIKNIAIIDPNDLAQSEKVILEQLEKDEPSVIISRRPCALLKYVKPKPALHIDKDKCKGCKACMKIGCPCISFKDNKASINHALCVGCGLCKNLCKFDAIEVK